MAHSLQAKIIFLIIAIMFITAVIIVSISNKEIGNAMLDQQDRLSKHVLSLIDLNIKAGYNNLITDKIDSVSRYKQLLQSRTGQVLHIMDRQQQFVRQNVMSQGLAEQVVKDWVIHATDRSHGTVFIADADLSIIAHPDPHFMAVDIGTFTDMKNNSIAQALDTEGAGLKPITTVINWRDDQHPLSKYLVCIQKYPPWNRVVGTVINIDDIEIEAWTKLEEIVETLGESFTKIHVGKTGFAFLFDNSLKVLAMTDMGLSNAFQKSLNTRTGNLLLQDMVTQAIQLEGPLPYQSDLFEQQEMIAYTNFFKPLGWYIGVTVPVSEIKQPARDIVSKQTRLIGVILFCSIVFTAWVVSRISKPLNVLADRVKAFSSTDLTRDEKEDTYLQFLAQKYKDEVGRLADAFVYMKKQLKDNIRQLIETTAENERIEGELNIAKDIQLGLLPKIFPPFPDRRELDIYASLEPAREVGGDLYDFYFIEDHTLCFTIGDVSGKGVPAALMMAITKTLIKTSASKNISPSDIMTEVNNAISTDNPHSMFVTLFIGILDLKTGIVTYANGGHNPAIHVAVSKTPCFVREISGPVVGIMDKISYKELCLPLAPGDALFLYTDGVTEAMNTQKVFYSEKTLLEQVAAHTPASSETVIKSIKEDLAIFAGNEPQYDDIAMLMIQYKGAQ
jgi:sigma-B regulation protein RsbU (phosphoserine phosphatase)